MANDFKAFATGVGALVTSQASYAADARLTNGVQPGIADPAFANKSWRQSSVIAATMAQFVADSLAANVVDDGNLATLLTQFKAAIAAKTDFVNLFAANGYAKFPGGLILQWGSFTGTTTAGSSPIFYTPSIAVSFPTIFPTACHVIMGSPQESGAVELAVSIGSKTTSGFSGSIHNGSGSISVSAWYLAVGN